MKKSLGQNFLKNPKILQTIAEAGEIGDGDVVLEIGPGSGALTDELLKYGAKIIAVEKDDKLAQMLKEKYKNTNIEIINEDILRYKIQDTRYKIVGNIPYYITRHLLRLMFTSWPPFDAAVLMVQKEVADRILAKPPHMNMLAVLVQLFCDVKRIENVGRGNFKPQPKVDSSVIKLKIKSQKSNVTEKLLQIASQGFAHPRKKLGNNLDEKLLKNAGIDPNRRAETLSTEEWKKLAS